MISNNNICYLLLVVVFSALGCSSKKPVASGHQKHVEEVKQMVAEVENGWTEDHSLISIDNQFKLVEEIQLELKVGNVTSLELGRDKDSLWVGQLRKLVGGREAMRLLQKLRSLASDARDGKKISKEQVEEARTWSISLHHAIEAKLIFVSFASVDRLLGDVEKAAGLPLSTHLTFSERARSAFQNH